MKFSSQPKLKARFSPEDVAQKIAKGKGQTFEAVVIEAGKPFVAVSFDGQTGEPCGGEIKIASAQISGFVFLKDSKAVGDYPIVYELL